MFNITFITLGYLQGRDINNLFCCDAHMHACKRSCEYVCNLIFLTKHFSISSILATNFNWLSSVALRLVKRWSHQSSVLCGSTSTRYAILSSFGVSFSFNFCRSLDVRIESLLSSGTSLSIFTNFFRWTMFFLTASSQLLEVEAAIASPKILTYNYTDLANIGVLLIYVHPCMLVGSYWFA